MNYRLRFDDFQAFANELWPHVSTQGMRISSNTLPELGEDVVVKVALRDGLPLFRAQGRVVARETEGEATGTIVIGFTELDRPSRTLLERIEEKIRGQGGVPFRLPVLHGRAIGAEPFDLTDLDGSAEVEPALESEPPTGPLTGHRQRELGSLFPEPATEPLTRPPMGQLDTGEDAEVDELSEVFEEGSEEEAFDTGPLRTPWLSRGVLAAAVVGAALALLGFFWLGRQGTSEPDATEGSSSPAARAGGASSPSQDETSASVAGSVVQEAPPTVLNGSPKGEGRAKGGAADQPATSEGSVAAAAASSGRGFRTVERMEWSREEGGTLVTVWLDGGAVEARIRRQRLDDPPREVVRLLQVRDAKPPLLTVDSPEVVTVRTGLHRNERGRVDLHLVADLRAGDVALAELRHREDRLELVFR